MSSRHSTWPVLLCIYNLPPWLCMKRKYIMMTLLIQGPKQPGNDIDVYLSPLIDDLKTLWSSGVEVYDAYKKEYFKMRGMIFCTISDFPAYGNLSGYSTKGKKACPVCEDETSSIWLKNCKKTVYMGHRRFLPTNHIYRKKKDEFDGNTEERTMRKRFDAFSRVENLNIVLGKRTRAEKGSIWKKKSIFWELPYWKHLDVRHCLDVMHIEKNVCDSLLGLLLNIPGKTKDGINIRKDMMDMGIRKELAPIEIANRIYLPPACYTMSKKKKESFVNVCMILKFHLTILQTLKGEIKACGPVFLRYMYPFERYMGFLKGYVRNRNRPEGSIVEGYASEEVIEFCTSYLEGVKSIGVPQSHHSGKLEGVGGVGMKIFSPSHDSLQLAHLLVLKHMVCIAPYVKEHMDILRSTNRGKDEMWYVIKHNKEFSSWMKTKVITTNVDQVVKRLGQGPDFKVRSYQGYDINGYTFYTKNQDEKSTMQNSGVTIIASTTEFDRMNHSKMLRIAKESYYGVIQEIWELNYHSFIIPVFKCKWVNNRTSVKVDNYGFTLVDLTSDGYVSEPFVLAKQVTQVFFVNDPSKPRYHIVLQGKRRVIDVDNVIEDDEYDQFDDLPPFSIGIQLVDDRNEGSTYIRSDHGEGIYVDKPC
ncbi:hypothetical protein E3N88_33972 [Mikania micrantha]|uniref:DUF4218 domain-containing protein n=1 Tax=Mikania micrantha TaxID=192012 RepID=A0A5N6ME95_9ASTR|nr:hypothetical protein E3N88_33972 [Mikania micrantha]